MYLRFHHHPSPRPLRSSSPHPFPAKVLRRPRLRRRRLGSPALATPTSRTSTFGPLAQPLAQPLGYALGAALALVLLRLVSLTLELLLPLWEGELRRRFALEVSPGHRLRALGGRALEALASALGLGETPRTAPAAVGDGSRELAALALERARCEESAARLRLETARLEAQTAAPPPATPW